MNAAKTEKLNKPLLALVGNPNCGKTAIFNLLTGLNQKVSNYPGVTVERKIGSGRLSDNTPVEYLDLPGTYSITPESFDERIVAEEVLKWAHDIARPDVIISVVDASNLSRNLYLTTQLQDLGIPVIIALNMMDRVLKKDMQLDAKKIKEQFGIANVIPMSAIENWGLDELKEAIAAQLKEPHKTDMSHFPYKMESTLQNFVDPMANMLENDLGYTKRLAWAQALRIIIRPSTLEVYKSAIESGVQIPEEKIKELSELRQKINNKINQAGQAHRTLEATIRYRHIDSIIESFEEQVSENINDISISEKADRILTHQFFGPLIFISLLYFIFQSIFTWASYPMDWIGMGMSKLGGLFLDSMEPGMLRDLLVEGAVAGVGAILVFLPQILILVFFLTLLEDSGYMARVAFLLDRFMNRIGLHGRSVLPLMSGYACAIPGIMATRTIDSWKERLITTLIIPLMSCSARLPVYTLLIGTFIPSLTVFGIFDLQSLTLVSMYFLGTSTALILAKIFSLFIKTKGSSSFVMELPPYRVPLMRSVFHQVYTRGKLFVLNAGKIILAISIILWFLASYPQTDKIEPGENPIHSSFAGKIGHAIEPVIAPLGFDWKIGIGLITSFAAREVLVSTMATIYSVEDEGDAVINLSEAMKKDTDPVTGKPRYTPLVALALMVFFVYAAQCMATFAIVRNETNSWKWPIFMIIYMTTLAYLGALIVFQGGKLLGFS